MPSAESGHASAIPTRHLARGPRAAWPYNRSLFGHFAQGATKSRKNLRKKSRGLGNLLKAGYFLAMLPAE